MCPGVAICKGVTCTLGVHGLPGSRVSEGIRRITGVLRVSRLLSQEPTTLSNNRGRQITVKDTVVQGPGTFLVSRPLSGLSTGLHTRVHIRLIGLRGRLSAAVVCMARSRARTVALKAGVIIVGSNLVRRIKTPRDVCSGPMGLFITNFLNSPSVGFFQYAMGTRRGGHATLLLSSTGAIGGICLSKAEKGRVTSECGNERIVLKVHPRSVCRLSRTGGLNVRGRDMSMSRPMMGHRVLKTRIVLCFSRRNGALTIHLDPRGRARMKRGISLCFSVRGTRIFSPRARRGVFIS